MSVKEKVSAFALSKAMDYVSGDPVKNLPQLLNWIDALGIKSFEPQSKAIHEVLDNPDNNWYKYLMGIWRDIDNDVLKTVMRNFALNANILAWSKQEALAEKYGCNIPMTMLIDPTSACNLKCTGCWAAEYGNKLNMSYEELDDIIRQGKELNIYFYLYSGGEPLVRKTDLIRLCEEHDDCQFAAFTNGTLIDEAFADDLLRVKNFIPTASLLTKIICAYVRCLIIPTSSSVWSKHPARTRPICKTRRMYMTLLTNAGIRRSNGL